MRQQNVTHTRRFHVCWPNKRFQLPKHLEAFMDLAHELSISIKRNNTCITSTPCILQGIELDTLKWQARLPPSKQNMQNHGSPGKHEYNLRRHAVAHWRADLSMYRVIPRVKRFFAGSSNSQWVSQSQVNSEARIVMSAWWTSIHQPQMGVIRCR